MPRPWSIPDWIPSDTVSDHDFGWILKRPEEALVVSVASRVLADGNWCGVLTYGKEAAPQTRGAIPLAWELDVVWSRSREQPSSWSFRAPQLPDWYTSVLVESLTPAELTRSFLSLFLDPTFEGLLVSSGSAGCAALRALLRRDRPPTMEEIHSCACELILITLHEDGPFNYLVGFGTRAMERIEALAAILDEKAARLNAISARSTQEYISAAAEILYPSALAE